MDGSLVWREGFLCVYFRGLFVMASVNGFVGTKGVDFSWSEVNAC